jgi:hypothetical protein
MNVRPFPSRDRALRQIMRRHRNEIPPSLQPSGREAGTRIAFAALPSGREYVLSTRRPGAVSGPA